MTFDTLLAQIRSCTHCAATLPCGARPIVQLHPNATILVVGQAPGRLAHKTGTPFNDPSGVRLRAWMGITEQDFYNPEKVAILPMGFCYPGTGKNGDLPPSPECAPLWRKQALAHLPNIQTTLIIGKYAQDWHTPHKGSLTQLVQNWQELAPNTFPLPHPSPRNNLWLKKNPWFETDVLPTLKKVVAQALSTKPNRAD